MRTSIRPLLFAGAASLVPALAMGAAAGFVVLAEDPSTPGAEVCSNTADLTAASPELYSLKITTSASDRNNDWLWNTDVKTEPNSDTQSLLQPSFGGWSTGDVWALNQAGTDMAFTIITTDDGRIFVDSNDQSSIDWGAGPIQTIGNSLHNSLDAGIDLVIPGTSATYTANLGPNTKSFPVRATPSGSATAGSVNIAFSPVVDVNPTTITVGCDIAGRGFNPKDATRGVIIGYNVYRMPGAAGTPPTAAQWDATIRDNDDTNGGWVYFLNLRTFNVALADSTPPGSGTDAPSDAAATDLTGLQNPDGRMYSGDEVVIFQDSHNRAGISRVRAAQLAPLPGVSYWYAVQPVVFGNMGSATQPTINMIEFSNADFTVNSVFGGDHRIDIDGDGEFDAVSLNSTVAGGHNSPEFISPQAEASNGGQPGLGLTNGGRLLLSPPMFIDAAAALPAQGQVRLTGALRGNDVNVEFTTGLERGNVLGYNVYRVSGDSRVRVNEQPILAQGNESNVYSIVDVATRARGARSQDYMVEIVYSDGTSSTMVGPFTVSLDQQPVRRRR